MSMRAGEQVFLHGRRQRVRRSRFDTALRERPTAFAAASCVSPNSSIRRCKPLRLLERIQVLALDVLDQRERERRLIGNVLHERRDLAQPCLLRRAPAALAGDDLEAAAIDGPHEDRLHHPLLANR